MGVGSRNCPHELGPPLSRPQCRGPDMISGSLKLTAVGNKFSIAPPPSIYPRKEGPIVMLSQEKGRTLLGQKHQWQEQEVRVAAERSRPPLVRAQLMTPDQLKVEWDWETVQLELGLEEESVWWLLGTGAGVESETPLQGEMKPASRAVFALSPQLTWECP